MITYLEYPHLESSQSSCQQFSSIDRLLHEKLFYVTSESLKCVKISDLYRIMSSQINCSPPPQEIVETLSCSSSAAEDRPDLGRSRTWLYSRYLDLTPVNILLIYFSLGTHHISKFYRRKNSSSSSFSQDYQMGARYKGLSPLSTRITL